MRLMGTCMRRVSLGQILQVLARDWLDLCTQEVVFSIRNTRHAEKGLTLSCRDIAPYWISFVDS
jgi:hypothetical protein